MFNSIISDSNMYRAYKNTLRGQPKYKVASIKFSQNETQNLYKLRELLISGDYKPSGYNKFLVFEPKERVVDAPRYKDKIVQHMVNNILSPWFTHKFISDSYACIPNRGNGRAVYQLQHYLRKGQYLYGKDMYLVKADISKFFYSIDRGILTNILAGYINCPKTLQLVLCIINSSPDNKGLPLGNLTSQLLANVYLNELDQYIKRRLRVPFYLRYADDMFAICKSKLYAQEILEFIKEFTTNNLKLILHPYKSSILSPNEGLSALGFKIYPTHILLNQDSKLRIKKKLNKVNNTLNSITEINKIEQQLNGWINHASYSQSYLFLQSLINKYSFLNLDNNKLFKIQKS